MYLLFSLFPAHAIYGEESPAKDASIVYIIDISCSMDSQWQTAVGTTTRLEAAARAIARSLDRLDEGHRFDIVAFASPEDPSDAPVLPLWNGLTSATAEAKTAATAFLASLHPSGASPVGPSVAWSVSNPAYEDAGHYVVLTDGSPNCTDSGWGWADWRKHLSMASTAHGREGDTAAACLAGGGDWDTDPAEHMALIRAANTKGARVHVHAVGATTAGRQRLLEPLAAETSGEFSEEE